MLTADLVRARRRGDALALVPLAPSERPRALALARAYLDLAAAHVGRSRGALLGSFRQVAVAAHEQRLAAGLRKLVLDGCVIEENAGADPPALRDELFARAAAARRDLGPHDTFDRARLVAETAAARGLSPAALEAGLYADLPEAHVVRAAHAAPPERLLDDYGTAQAQAVLLRATRVTCVVREPRPAASRALFRRLKFLQLLHRIEREPTPTASRPAPPAGAAYRIEIDGPMSLFEATTRYGLRLALILPALAACTDWSLFADVRWGKARTPLRFRMNGSAAPAGHGTATDALPDEVRTLLDACAALDGPWRARASAALIDLPGGEILAPDLDFVHTDGRVVHLEALGFWSRDAVFRRIDLAARGLPAPFVFAASRRLRVSEAALPDELPAALYVYARAMNPTAVLARVEAAAAGVRTPPRQA